MLAVETKNKDASSYLITLQMPGDDNDEKDEDGDWSDVDDEDFEDIAEDNDDSTKCRLKMGLVMKQMMTTCPMMNN